MLRRLAHLLGMSDKLLTEKVRLCTAHVSQPCWPGSPYQPIPVAQHVPDAIAVQIMQDHASYPGVSAGVNPVARYPQPNGANPAQVLGYLGPITAQQMKQQHLPTTGFAGVDLVGQAGLEAQYNQDLQGTPGQQVLSVNSAGQQLGVVRNTAPKTGNDLVTSINARLQGDVQTVLANTIRKAQQTGSPKATTGAAIVMTTTGRVVAMASVPTYNPSVWNGGISEKQYRQLINGNKPILNRVTQGEYAPGSTFKVTSTAAAVKAGYSLAGTYNCPASYNIGGRSFLNDGQKNLGQMSLHEALVISCDTVFYELAYGTYQHDHPKANVVTSPKAPIQEMQKMEAGLGIRQGARNRPARAGRRQYPDPGMAVLPLEGQCPYWAELVQVRPGQWHICAADRISGLPLRQRLGTRRSGDRGHRPGLRGGDPAPAGQRLRGAGQRRQAVQPPDRRGHHQPHREGGPEDQAQADPPPAGGREHAGLHPQRAGRRDHGRGHRGQRVRRLSPQPGLRGGQDGYG